MGKVAWNGERYKAALRRAMDKRLRAASIHLAGRIKADISQSGTLRMTGKKGRVIRTIYNYTHSAPGNPPYKQSGHLRRTITWEIVNDVGGRPRGRVGTNLKYGRYLEQGTKKMRPRPYLSRNLRLASQAITRILTGRIRPGEMVIGPSNQFRSGIMGRNFSVR